MTPGIGHNSGKTFERGTAWRRHVWTRARADLLPKLPVEIVRLRVKRAKELGLPYRSYAGFRAATGHDLVGFLFSTNALRLYRDGAALPADRAAKLADLRHTDRVALAQPPLTPETLAGMELIDAAAVAPGLHQSWSETRAAFVALARACGHAADRYVIVGETGLERDWTAAAGAAGFLTGATYFDTV